MRFSRLIALLSLVLGATMLLGAPAQATTRTLTTSYTCTAKAAGQTFTGTSAVTVSVGLPSQVHVGTFLKARPISVSIVVPKAILDKLRSFSVDAVSATSTDARYRVGGTSHPIRNLVVPKTDVPSSGAMTLPGSGTAAGFTAGTTGSFAVRVPKAFTAAGTAYGAFLYGDTPISMSCSLAVGAPSRLSTLSVVA